MRLVIIIVVSLVITNFCYCNDSSKSIPKTLQKGCRIMAVTVRELYDRVNSLKLKRKVIKLQLEYIGKIRAIKEPVQISYQGKDLTVLPNVFPPYTDSYLVVDTMKVGKSDVVLDACTGSGIIAVFAAEKARHVIATDINTSAIENVRRNAEINGLGNKIEAVHANIFPDETTLFDVITINPPYTDYRAKDVLEQTVWDEGHKTVKYFFENVRKHLKPNGRIYLGWANFADLNFIYTQAKIHNFEAKIVAEKREGDSIFVTFELTPIVI
jgi:release factor glutamine methyltransferase